MVPTNIYFIYILEAPQYIKKCISNFINITFSFTRCSMKLNTICPDFKGQEFSIGIDTHKSNWKVTVRSGITELKTFSMNPSPEELKIYMQHNYPNGKYNSVYEAGFCGYWIHRELTKYQFENIIVNPADVPSTNKERDRKCDPIDSRKLSRERANNSMKGIFVPDEKQESLRCIYRLFKQYTRRVTQLKGRIKGYLYFVGVKIPQEFDNNHCWSNNFLKYLTELKFTTNNHKYVMDDHIKEFKHARESKRLVLKQIREICKGIETIRFLNTIPGIGMILSFALYTELMNMNRFKNLDNLSSYIGLVPSTQSSDKSVTVRGITFRHSEYLRDALIESAWIAIRNDPALLSAFNGLLPRMEKSEAIIRIAKKLLNRIRYVWINQTEYDKGVCKVSKEKQK